jgi:hypothetical protein
VAVAVAALAAIWIDLPISADERARPYEPTGHGGYVSGISDEYGWLHTVLVTDTPRHAVTRDDLQNALDDACTQPHTLVMVDVRRMITLTRPLVFRDCPMEGYYAALRVRQWVGGGSSR